MAIAAIKAITYITASMLLSIGDDLKAINHIGIIVIKEGFVKQLLNTGLALLGMAHRYRDEQ